MAGRIRIRVHRILTRMVMAAGHVQIGFVPWDSTVSVVLHIRIHIASNVPTSQQAILHILVQATTTTVNMSLAAQIRRIQNFFCVQVLSRRLRKALRPTLQQIWCFTSKCQWTM